MANIRQPLKGGQPLKRGQRLWSQSVSSNNQRVSDQSPLVQSHSQSQAMLTFVTALEIDNFECTKIQPV